MMSPPPADWDVRSANTAPTPAHETSPVYAPPQYYQPQVPSHPGQTMPPYQPPRRRSPVGWILAFVGMGLFVALILAVIFVSRAAKRVIDEIPRGSGSSRAEALSGETMLNETSGAQVTTVGNETTLIKNFPLGEDSTFAIKNISGSVTVETWDKAEAQVTVIKRGSESDRGAAQVYFKTDGDGLSLRTAYRGSNKSDVVYQIKLPRGVESIDLNTVNGGIKLSNVSAEEIEVATVNGSIELSNVAGVRKAKSVRGNIKAVLKEASTDDMEFENVNGNIEVQIKGNLNADLDAASVRGTITIDDQFGVQVQKQVVGQKANGQIGSGGTPLNIKTVNGSITLSK
jgi:Putative adhesin